MNQNIIKCEYGKNCGNCKMLGMSYEDTLARKLKYVNECLAKENLNIKVNEIIPSENEISYRNKMIIGFKVLKGDIIAGFYEEGTHRIVNMDHCLMHTDAQNNILKQIIYLVKKMHISIYDEDKRYGVLRYLMLREAFKTNEIMITLVTATEEFPGRGNLVKAIKDIDKNIKTIVQNINPRKTSIVLGDKIRVLYGPGFIYDYIGELKFKLSPKSFFQVNPLQAKSLYEEVKKLANLKGNETVIDAYSGVATIGLTLAKHAKQVFAIENNKEACFAAISNAKDNNIKNIEVVNDDATMYLVNQAKQHNSFDLIVLDPPRSGSSEAFLDSVAKTKARKVIYVSCGPESLARDLAYIKKYNYTIEKIKCFDMFPYTAHVETISCLVLKKE